MSNLYRPWTWLCYGAAEDIHRKPRRWLNCFHFHIHVCQLKPSFPNLPFFTPNDPFELLWNEAAQSFGFFFFPLVCVLLPRSEMFKNSVTMLSDLSWQLFWRRHSGLKRALLPPIVVWIARTQLMTAAGHSFLLLSLAPNILALPALHKQHLELQLRLQRMKPTELLTLSLQCCSVSQKRQKSIELLKYSVVKCVASAWLCYSMPSSLFSTKTPCSNANKKSRGSNFNSHFLGFCYMSLFHWVSSSPLFLSAFLALILVLCLSVWLELGHAFVATLLTQIQTALCKSLHHWFAGAGGAWEAHPGTCANRCAFLLPKNWH